MFIRIIIIIILKLKSSFHYFKFHYFSSHYKQLLNSKSKIVSRNSVSRRRYIFFLYSMLEGFNKKNVILSIIKIFIMNACELEKFITFSFLIPIIYFPHFFIFYIILLLIFLFNQSARKKKKKIRKSFKFL